MRRGGRKRALAPHRPHAGAGAGSRGGASANDVPAGPQRPTAAAMRQFELCRQVLSDELGVNARPGYHSAVPAHPCRATCGGRLSPHVAAARNLPAPLTPLIGREDELAAIRRRLADPSLSFAEPRGSRRRGQDTSGIGRRCRPVAIPSSSRTV